MVYAHRLQIGESCSWALAMKLVLPMSSVRLSAPTLHRSPAHLRCGGNLMPSATSAARMGRFSRVSFSPTSTNDSLGRVIVLAGGQNRPGDACHPVGHRHRHHLGRFGPQHPLKPWRHAIRRSSIRRSSVNLPQHRHGAVNQQGSNVPLAHLGDRPDPLSASGAVLLRGAANPRRELPTVAELFHLSRERENRIRCDRSDSGNCLQTPRRRRTLHPDAHLLGKRLDPRRQCRHRLEQRLQLLVTKLNVPLLSRKNVPHLGHFGFRRPGVAEVGLIVG